MRRADSFENTLDAGKDWSQEEKVTTEGEMVGWHHRLNGWVWVNSGSWRWTGKPGLLQSMGSQRVGHDWATELKWTEGLVASKWLTQQPSCKARALNPAEAQEFKRLCVSPSSCIFYLPSLSAEIICGDKKWWQFKTTLSQWGWQFIPLWVIYYILF